MGRTALDRERVNVSFPRDLLASIDGEASRLGMDRSAFVSQLARDYFKQAPVKAKAAKKGGGK